jgi:hypothetical protein
MTPEDKAKLIESDLKQADAKRRADAAEQEKLKMEKDEKAKADADEMRGNMDKLLNCMDSISKRMDVWEAGMADKAKKDAEGEEIKEKGDPKELAADSRSDSRRADSAEVVTELAEIQSYADRADSAWSKTSPAPWSHEMPDSYRRRLAAPHQRHSELWKDADLAELRGVALKNACQQIFADSIKASGNNELVGELNLREIRRRDPDTGHLIRKFRRDPMSWMQQFCGGRRLARFRLDQNGR